ncbi:energy-coupling factor transporter transmembrane component T [Oscillospiraceae bacterium 44-34]
MALKDITLGQYFPGNSPVHRLDPRTKLICVVLYIVALFLANWFITYAVMLAVLAGSIAISKVPPKSILRGLKPVLFIVVFTAVLNIFYTPGNTVLAHFWIFTITLEGVWRALFMVVRIMMLIAGTFLLTYTTSPILLTDGLESLMGPLKKVKVPVHELAMMMSIALRFIPTLIEETDKIMSAQRARGADFESGNLIQRAKALLPLLVPLFISAFRRADELATAMECRCYHGGEGRTRLRQLKYKTADYVTLFLFLTVTVGVGVLGHLGL